MGEWYERSGATWSAAEREAARAHLAPRWATVTGDPALPPLTLPPGVPAAGLLGEVLRGRGYPGSRSIDLFAAYASLHVRAHLLLASGDRERRIEAMTAWLQDVRSVAYHRLTLAAYGVAKVPSEDVGGLVVLFCHQDLGAVVDGYDPDELFWPYLTISFQNFVRRQVKSTRRWEAMTTPWEPAAHGGDQRAAPAGDDEPDEEDEQEAAAGAGPMRRVIARELGDLRRQEIEKHGQAGTDGCAACLGLTVLERSYFQRERADHAAIARELGISVGNCRVLLTRTLHRVRERVARYPVALEASGDGWRVKANDVALWDTVVRIACEPVELATPGVEQLTIRQGMERSIDVVRLRTTPFETGRPTAVVFDDGGCQAGETVTGTIHVNQVRLAARSNGRAAHVWIAVPPRRPAGGRVEMIVSTPDAVTTLAVGEVRGPSPLRCEVQARETVVALEVVTGARPGPARVTVEPATVCGGAPDAVRATVTLGARIEVQMPGGGTGGVLPIAPRLATPSPASGLRLTSSDPEHLSVGKLRRREDSAMFDAALRASAVPGARAVVMLATGEGCEVQGALTVLPPPIVAVRLAATRVRAGESVAGTVEVRSPIVASGGAPVTLSASHGGIVFDPPPPVIAAGSTEASFVCRAVTEARAGVARIVATANESTAAADVDVVANGIKAVTFEPHVVKGGATATGTVLCHHPLGDTVTIQVTSTDGLAVVGPVTLAIPKNAARATFSVNTKPVKRAATVEIIADGLGGRVSGRLRLTP